MSVERTFTGCYNSAKKGRKPLKLNRGFFTQGRLSIVDLIGFSVLIYPIIVLTKPASFEVGFFVG